MKSRRSTSEFLEAPQIAEELKGIEELLKEETKDKKNELKKQQGENVLMDVEEEDAIVAAEEEEPIKTVCTHMVIAETDKPDLPCKKDANADQMAKLNEKLMAFKKSAQRKAHLFKCQKKRC